MTVGIYTRIRFIVLSAFLCVIATGCEILGNDANEELECLTKPIPGVFHPLEVGNRWEYESPVNLTQEYPNLIYEVTGKLEQTDELGSELFVVSRYRKGEEPFANPRIWANSDQGFEYAGYITDDDTLLGTSHTFSFPTFDGQVSPVFSVRRDEEDGSIVRNIYNELEVLAVDHSTIVPMGEFETIVYVEKWYVSPGADFPTGPFLHSFAPGVGRVARDHGANNQDLEVEAPSLRLVDYCLMQ